MTFELPKLSYDYTALEPYIDAKTMEIHYTKHHQAYVDKLNAAVEKYPDLSGMTVEDLLKNIKTLAVDEKDRTAIQNTGGGHYNHSFFWEIMSPEKVLDSSLADSITETFLSVDEFKKKFTEAAVGRFGSGWAWLAKNAQGQLEIYSTANQDSPIMQGHTPIIGLDVWEHAYYLKYQNRRPEYIENWWKTIKFI